MSSPNLTLPISFAPPLLDGAEIEAVSRVLESGWLTTGPQAELFEKDICDYIGSKYAVAVNSCTAGLHLSLIASGVGEGDEVIVPSFTFASTAHVVQYVGAKPILSEICDKTLVMGVEDVLPLITQKTKAIILVHYGGFACDLEAFYRLADEKGIQIIEDAAHAIGTEYQGKKIGSFGKLTCFSFYATKNMTTGEGGMVVTNDESLANKIRILSMYGIDDARSAAKRYNPKGNWYYDIQHLGFKYNLTDIAAAIGIQQLKKLPSFIKRRKEIADFYKEAFKGLDQIRIPEWNESEKVRASWHLFPILLTESVRSKRDDWIANLKDKKIGTSVLFRPLHHHSYYQTIHDGRLLPQTDKLFDSLICLPISPLLDHDQLTYIVSQMKSLCQK